MRIYIFISGLRGFSSNCIRGVSAKEKCLLRSLELSRDRCLYIVIVLTRAKCILLFIIIIFF